MRKFIAIFCTFLFLSFSINTLTLVAEAKTFSKGFYTMENLGLYPNIPYTVQNSSTHNDGLLIILDGNKTIQQIIRIRPQSQKYTLIPLMSDYVFILYGDFQLNFS